MCGLTGFLCVSARDHHSSLTTCLRMSNALAHRGPDDTGTWHDHEAGLYLGFRRLAIIDLSAAGHQPMVSSSGRYVLVYNGEIYNHQALRRRLEEESSPEWRGDSDTETLLRAIETWGVDDALNACNGMFAFALWDRQRDQLTLARDRFGEKPLYYGWQGDVFMFGSELKALRRHPSFKGVVDRDALCLQLRYNCIPAPHTIYQGIYKLPPGSKLVVRRSTRDPLATGYWSPEERARAADTSEVDYGSDTAVVEQFATLLEKSVTQQMIADVPLGATLSGGIDSSLIVSVMQSVSERPINTFTIGFDEDSFSEAKYARRIAKHLGTNHEEMLVGAQDVRDVIPNLAHTYDEPFSDSSQIPTSLVSALARQHVTVALSGDGADELFGGYNRYRVSEQLWPKIQSIPLPIRRQLARLLRAVPAKALNGIAGALSNFDSNAYRWGNLGHKSHKFSEVLGSQTIDHYYRALVSHWSDPADIVLGGTTTLQSGTGGLPALTHLSDTERMMIADMQCYLPDDILVKVDRASMAVSLEMRAPYLDRNVAEFALGLPLSLKIRKGRSKWIMREALSRFIPDNLLERPKMGFAVPIGDWLRDPLRDWAEELLNESRLKREGFFNPTPIRRKWAEHLVGTSDWQYHLWDILMFQAWLESLD